MIVRRRRPLLVRILITLGIVIGTVLVLLGGLVAYWSLRPNTAEINPALGIEEWSEVTDGKHNSNTDMVYWRNEFYLVHAASPFHMGTARSRLVLWRSPDARTWERIAEFKVDDTDVRDPKLAAIGDRLILYVLINDGFEPSPYATAAATSSDGIAWTGFEPIEPEGWLFWRPKSLDGITWYTAAYWKDHGRSILLKSTDGLQWDLESPIHVGDRNDETAIEFLPDGRLLATARLEGTRAIHQGAKDAATLIATSSPPYADWTSVTDRTSRLDGPALFTVGGQVYAIGRYDPEGYDKWYGNSSLLGRKRTSVYRVTESGLQRLSDLPSAGDTSYAGVVEKDGFLYVSYYTNRTDRDFAWLLGLVRPTAVRIVRIPTGNLFMARPI